MFDWHALTEVLRSEKVHQMSKGIDYVPHTAQEPLSQNEIIVIGGDSWNYPNMNADSIIIDTVRNIRNLCILLQISDFQHRDEA